MATVFGQGGLHDDMHGLGVDSFSLACSSAHDYPRAALSLARRARAAGVDAIHAIEIIPAFVAGLARRLGAGAPAGFSRQHITMDSAQMNRLCWAAARLCDVTIACSAAAADAARTVDRTSAGKVQIVHNGANRPREVGRGELERLRAQFAIPTDARIISVVARLRPVKGLDVLLRCTSKVAAALPSPLHVVIAGDGESRGELAALAARSGCQVHFAGEQQDVTPWFALGDVVAMPSRSEGLGVAALEAMAAGRPLVASAVGGLPEVVANDETGILVPAEDADALAAGLLAVLSDEAGAAEMGRRAKARFERLFTNERMVEGWLGVYAGCRAS
jgi:glycosyltransferase involved in cell wall biosynthesis